MSYIKDPDKKSRVVIGTHNESKYDDFKLFLDGYEVVYGGDLGGLDVPEGMHSLEENAIAKARAWCIKTGKPAIADDTGFFIEALHGEPGIAARRWAGELPDTATNEDFWAYLQKKTINLPDLSAYVEQCVAVAPPNGKVAVVRNRTNGYLDKEKLQKPYNDSGYPLAAAFVAKDRVKAWDEMSDAEKLAYNSKFVSDLKRALESVITND